MPVISEHAASGAQAQLRKFVSKSIRVTAFTLIPIAVMLFIIRTPLVKLLFQRGAFDANDTYLTSTVFLFYDIGLVPFCLNIVFLAVFYALQDPITPLKISAINFVLNIILDLTLMRWLGVSGIALATSLIVMLNTVLLLGLLRKKIGYLDGGKIFISLLKISLAAGLMGFVVWSIPNNFDSLFKFKNQILELSTLFFIGFVAYSTACIVLRVSEFEKILNLVQKNFVLS